MDDIDRAIYICNRYGLDTCIDAIDMSEKFGLDAATIGSLLLIVDIQGNANVKRTELILFAGRTIQNARRSLAGLKRLHGLYEDEDEDEEYEYED